MSTNKNYKYIDVKSGFNKINSPHLPYSWDLNIYRGCSNGCKYCFAQYSHYYLGNDDFYNSIYVKQNIVEMVKKELQSNKTQGKIVNLGGVTDSYQEIEKELEIMPKLLKLFIKYKTPVIISTKSDLILRDYNLLDELSRIAHVNIACTITSADEDIAKKIEPGAVSTCRRFSVLYEFSKSNAKTGVHMMPIIPFITDNRENIDKIYQGGYDAGVNYVLPGTLNLKGETKPYFLNFIKYSFPQYYDDLIKLYETAYAPKEYQRALYKIIKEISRKYDLDSVSTRKYKKVKKTKTAFKQLSIWDE